MTKSILMIEGEHDDILYLRKLVNSSRVNRNMVWHENRVLRFNGDTTYAELHAILDRVIQQIEDFEP